jgi:hypothetical protein
MEYMNGSNASASPQMANWTAVHTTAATPALKT